MEKFDEISINHFQLTSCSHIRVKLDRGIAYQEKKIV